MIMNGALQRTASKEVGRGEGLSVEALGRLKCVEWFKWMGRLECLERLEG